MENLKVGNTFTGYSEMRFMEFNSDYNKFKNTSTPQKKTITLPIGNPSYGSQNCWTKYFPTFEPFEVLKINKKSIKVKWTLYTFYKEKITKYGFIKLNQKYGLM